MYGTREYEAKIAKYKKGRFLKIDPFMTHILLIRLPAYQI